jgi:hypothetical protein
MHQGKDGRRLSSLVSSESRLFLSSGADSSEVGGSEEFRLTGKIRDVFIGVSTGRFVLVAINSLSDLFDLLWVCCRRQTHSKDYKKVITGGDTQFRGRDFVIFFSFFFMPK